ncbi:Oxidoreductase [Coemansia spiralis]|nr:Oxidoreductase [Coemansia spiralis]
MSSSGSHDESTITSAIDTAELGGQGDGAGQQGAGADEAHGGEGEQSQAFNPETGEINWDCPCLGGMAQGTCGEQFKTAFSCFVHSEEEPKGMDCVDAFRAMQDCFRAHPEEYADEIADDDEPDMDSATDSTSHGDTDAETDTETDTEDNSL